MKVVSVLCLPVSLRLQQLDFSSGPWELSPIPEYITANHKARVPDVVTIHHGLDNAHQPLRYGASIVPSQCPKRAGNPA